VAPRPGSARWARPSTAVAKRKPSTSARTYHLPLAELLTAFLDAGLRIEHVSEPGPEEYPRLLAVAARR